ncbi:MAG: hypothetical protein M1830_006623 [Pleopsidium flavum]|nr:MAG: hypothetical protein M1830_006623 [Pleopsidium flavum]
MARTLPWLKEAGAVKSEAKRDRPVKKQRIMEPESEEDDPNSTGVSTPRRKAMLRPVRTPSTSPPPEPPKEEFMEEGLDGDDAYIMVEDEFQAIAKSFTQHLHHAEYVRLKNLAKTQNASTINTISRPVDSITKMREETKKKKEAEARSVKQENALQQMKAQAGRPKSDDDESDMDDNMVDDPWVGTSLQGLMTSPRKSQTSLTGLDGVKSKTRAAAGYAKAERRSVQNALPFDLSPKRVVQGAKANQSQVGDDTTSSEDDDLDAPAARKPARLTKLDQTPTRKIARELLARVKFADLPAEGNQDQRSRISSIDNTSFASKLAPRSSNTPFMASSSSLESTKKTSKPMFASFEDHLKRTTLPDEASQRMAKRMTELKVQKTRDEIKAKKKTTQTNEIPVFLV